MSKAWPDIPVDVGPQYEGERVRYKHMRVELGGPRVERKFELCRVRPLGEVEDGKVAIIGPDIKEMGEKSTHPLGIIVEVAGGPEVTDELEGVFERRIHEFSNWINGLMHLQQRYDIHLRLSETAFKKGFNSFELWGEVLRRLYKAELPIIKRLQVTFITDPERIVEPYEEAVKVYGDRDARVKGMKDEDVDVFYGCTLCQSFAPSHVCVISPQRFALCGAVSWIDGRASAKIDPKGPNFPIEKGECLDPIKGEYAGVNKIVDKYSMGENNRFFLYSGLEYPPTSCGCFECIAFFIPEVEGFGIVDRAFAGNIPIGITFTALADQAGGGRQTPGMVGVSVGYMRSPKFLYPDGGWERVVWLTSRLKELMKGHVPDAILDKIPTEMEAADLESLKKFLEERKHPVVERWPRVEAVAPPATRPASEAAPALPSAEPIAMPTLSTAATGAPPIVITLKNAKIFAERVIIKTYREEGEKGK